MIETTNQLWLQENNVMLNVHFISNKKPHHRCSDVVHVDWWHQT